MFPVKHIIDFYKLDKITEAEMKACMGKLAPTDQLDIKKK